MLSRALYLGVTFLSVLASTVACGSGGSDLSSEPSPSSSDQGGEGAGAKGSGNGSGERSPSATTPSTPIPTREVKLTLHNRTTGTLLLLKDYQAPLWLEIGSPAYMLNGYGQSWCGHKDYGHNEPAFLSQEVPPGGSLTVKWNGLFVAFDDDASCWRFQSVPSGSLPAKACVYEGNASPGELKQDGLENPFPAGPGPRDAPSTWFTNAPTRCIPFTIDLKDGGSTLELEVEP
jgi:hypothetical protein